MTRIDKLKQEAREYVEMEASVEVEWVEEVQTFSVFDKKAVVLLAKSNEGDFWVVCGDFPMNLYDTDKFGSADEAVSFHLGLALRISERQESSKILLGRDLEEEELLNNVSPKAIVEFAEKRKGHFYPSWEGRESIPFEISPGQFLKFAERAIKEGTQGGSVNALSNVKRAIECQLDLLLYILGQHKKAQKEDWRFPKKIDFIRSIGLVAPEVLRKINKKRIELEHYYKSPSSDEVKDVFDIANLFLAYTSKFTERRLLGFGTELLRGELWINFDEDKNLFEIEVLEPWSKHIVDEKDENYLALLKIYVGLMAKM